MKPKKLLNTAFVAVLCLVACTNSNTKNQNTEVSANFDRQVIVRLNAPDQLQAFLETKEAQDLELIDSLITDPIYLFEFQAELSLVDIKANIGLLNQLDMTGYAEQNAASSLSVQERESSSTYQSVSFFPQNQFFTDFNPQQWAMQESDLLESVSRFKSGRMPINPVTVAVIDSGIDTYHKAFSDALWVNTGEIANNQIDDDNNGYVDDVHGYNFASSNNNIYDYDSHGTHVSGIIAARPRFKAGMSGIATQAKLMVLKYAEGSTGSTFAVIKGVEYAAEHGADIINMSLGSEVYSQALYDMVIKAHTKGIFMVAATGNDSKDLGLTPVYPAALNYVLAIAATNQDKTLASYSNYQSHNLWVSKIVALSAPGTQIYSTIPSNSYGYLSGTSMAAPQVAGAVALIKALYPTEDYIAINKRLFYGAERIKGLESKVYEGKKLNVYKSLFQPQPFELADGRPYREEFINGQARFNRYPYANSGDPGVDGNSWATAYKITTAKQLTNIRDQDLDKHFIIMNDIDWNFKTGGVHPNQILKVFNGKLSGQNFAIYNYKMNSNGPGGLFRNLGPNASIINLKFMNASVEAGSNSGILASISKGGIINNVQIQGSIKGDEQVGGLIGYTEGGKINNCYFEGYVEGNHRVGGLTGSANVGTAFFRNHVQAEITGNTAGGITGRISQSEIKQNYSNVLITGRDTLGGIAAYSRYSDIFNSYSQGEVSAQRFTAGGLIGQVNRSTVDKSYSLCSVNSEKYNGGLLGRGRDFIVTSSYYDRSQGNQGAGGIGKSFNELLQAATFQGWFVAGNPWSIPEGYHPVLISIPRTNAAMN
jgi:hypothetical protein